MRGSIQKKVQVYFVGAGPGDPDLITVKGKRIIMEADLIIYAGSLVPAEIISCKRSEVVAIDSSSMTLDEIHEKLMDAVRNGKMVARVHTGDPTLYGAIREQMVLLDKEGVSYEVIPGVTSAFATSAAARISLTIPDLTQTVIFTRVGGKTPVPARESLKSLALHGATIAIYLSASKAKEVEEELISGGYSEDTPVVIGYRVGWPDGKIIKGRLSQLGQLVKEHGIKRQAVFLITPFDAERARFSRLYDPEFRHRFRR